MVTAVAPAYLASVGLGATALGVMEGVADLLFSTSKLVGGWIGHHARRKLPWAATGYGLTSIATAAMAVAHSAGSIIGLRAVAWFGRGFRSPLRDFLLADEVGPTHFGRAYGFERAADMLGAVAGPLLALALLYFGVDVRAVIAVSLAPSLVSLLSFLVMVRDRPSHEAARTSAAKARLPVTFWLFLGGVFLFGLGDFSRTFLVLLAVRAVGTDAGATVTAVPLAVLLYALHNGVSAVAALGAGHLGDRYRKITVLAVGYGIGVGTNVLLSAGSTSLALLTLAVLLSGVYIAIEETIEKAAAAEMLPRELRSLGLGVLASANAVGDMASSLYVGVMLDAGRPGLAFAVPAAVGFAGLAWTSVVANRARANLSRRPEPGSR
jgi:MFS family permease